MSFGDTKFEQNALAALCYWPDRLALAKLRGAYRGKILFLVGGGPSLRDMDIAQLPARNALFMTVNNGHRLFSGAHIPFHTVSDIACYQRFGDEIEAADVGRRFYRSRFRATPTFRAHGDPERTIFIPARKGGLLKRGFRPQIERGLGNDSSVLVFAAQIAFHLGFDQTFVIGCDLDYSAPQNYAYALTEEDRAHEVSDVVQATRRALVHANSEFAILRTAFEAAGRQLLNAGLGGKLEALARLDFADALARAEASS